MRKWIFFLVLPLVIIFFSGHLLLTTTAGLKTLVTIADYFSDTEFSINVRSGDLYNGFTLTDIQYSDVSNKVLIDEFSIDWDFLSLISENWEIGSVIVKNIEILSASEADTSDEQVSIPLVPNISIDNFDVENLSLKKTDETEIIHLESVQTRISITDNEVEINNLQVMMPSLQAVTNGTVKLLGPYPVSIKSAITYVSETGPSIQADLALDGDINKLIVKLDRPDVSSTITIKNLADDPVWNGNLLLTGFNPNQWDATFPVMELNINLAFNGTSTSATGSSLVNIHYPSPTANPDSALDEQSSLLPEEIEIAFDTNLNMDESQLIFNDLTVSAGDASFHTTGRIDYANQVLSLGLDWADLTIFVQEIDETISSHGEATINGTLDSYQLTAEVNIEGDRNIPALTISTGGSGSTTYILLDSVDMEVLNGSVSAVVDANWQDTSEVSLSWRGEGLNVASIWPDWDSNLAASGGVSFSYVDEAWLLNLDPIDVSGQLNNLPLIMKISGSVETQSEIDISVVGNYSDFNVRFDGQIGDNLNINWQLNSPDLSQIHDSFNGSVDSIGSVGGTRLSPIINANIIANDINSPWGSAKSISGKISSNLEMNTQIIADATLESVSYKDVIIDLLKLDITGQKDSHKYIINAHLPELVFDIEGEGNYTEPVWSGNITRLVAEHSIYDTWSLVGPVNISLSPDLVSTSSVCMQYSRGSVCVDGKYDINTHDWQLNADSSQIPLSIFQSQLPGAPVLEGQSDVSFQLSGQEDRPAIGNLRIDVTNGKVTMDTSDEITYDIPLSGSYLQIDLENKLLKGQGEVPAINENFKPVVINLEVSGIENLTNPLDELGIQGALTAGGDDLSILSLVAPELETLKGRFDIDLKVSGTMLEPIVQGRADIFDASYDMIDLGIGISDINLMGTNLSENKYEITGRLQSGEGMIQARANITQITDQGLEIRADLTGENFELLNLPEVWAVVSPDIHSILTLNDQYYNGEVSVISGIIDLDEAAATSTLSADEIVDGKKTNDKVNPVNQHINVKVMLGDNIEIKGMGISGKLSGNLNLSNINTNNILVADGEIVINNGRYAAYGQELSIDEGRIIYNKVSLNNPTLSLTTTRIVDDITVGLRVRGYLSSLDITLFSSSNLPQEEILSYIVFGRPLNSLTSGEGQDLIGAATALGIRKSGFLTDKLATMFGLDQLALSGSTTQNASIVVGKYINPKLYLSYGLGIIDKISTAKLNYKLSNKFSLEAERSLETGVDIFYNLER